MRIAWLGPVAGGALSLILAASGCSTTGDRTEKIGAAKQGIQGGSLDTTHTYAVGVASSGGGICSGALIAPNVVVTARHCVQSIDYKNPQVPETIDCSLNPTFFGSKTMSVTTDATFSGATFRSVKKVVVPTSTSVCNNDIALLVLNNDIPSNIATPIIPGVQYPINYSKYLTSFTAIGYGNTSATGGGAGTRRIRELIRIQCIPGDDNIPCPADFPENEFVAGDGTCSGDSGSSAFEQGSFTFATPISLGVLSRGGQDASLCVGSVYTRLDKFRDLIVNTVTTESPSYVPNPDWRVYVPPEPKDAGAPKTDAGSSGTTTKPSGLGFGETCGADTECSSKLCGSEGACTTACEDSSTCPEGYDCRDAQCLTAAATPTEAPATSTTTTTDGCNTSGGTTPWGAVLLASAVAAAVGGRRRRRA